MIPDKLKEYIDKLIQGKLEEDTSATSGGEAYSPRYFLSRRNADISTYIKDGFTHAPKNPLKHSKVFDVKLFKESIKENMLNEISYRRFNQDVSKVSPERKIVRALQEVAKRIKEIDQVIEYSNRLKTENLIHNDNFWTSKSSQLDALSEKLNEISNKIRILAK